MRQVHGALLERLKRMLNKLWMNRRLLAHMLRHPRAIPSVWRIAGGARKYAKQYFDRRAAISGPPITVILRVTHRCNQRCLQCGQWGERGVLKQADKQLLNNELSTEEFKEVIRKASRFRPFISFFGGEPLLRDDMQELVASAASFGLLTTMNTNGLLLQEKAEMLLRAGLTYVKVSLDGPKGVNEQVRKAPDAYERTTAGIREIIALRKRLRSATPIVQLCSTITAENQYRLVELAEVADELGVDVLALLFGIFTTGKQLEASNRIFRGVFHIESSYWPGFVADKSGMDVEAIRKQVEEIKRRKWRFAYRQYPADTPAFDIGTHYRAPECAHGKGLCIVPWFRMEIMPNGDVVLCEDTPDIVAGNVRAQHLMDIWNGEPYQKFRRYILEHGVFPVCTRCSALYEIPHYSNSEGPNLRFPDLDPA